MTKELLKQLYKKKIDNVIIGGLALAMHGSPYPTFDFDIYIKIIDVDKVIDLLYDFDYYLCSYADNNFCNIKLNTSTAKSWLEKTKNGSLTFIKPKFKPNTPKISQEDISIAKIDFLFELSIPFAKLKKNSVCKDMQGYKINIAALKDLLILKQNRKDKRDKDLLDINFIKMSLAKKNKSQLSILNEIKNKSYTNDDRPTY